jgi:hypothetical protein
MSIIGTTLIKDLVGNIDVVAPSQLLEQLN